MKKAYEERVIYQIYPASFYDSNNDGWGDLKGISEKLDYLKDLGVGIIWLSPVYTSPLIDMGYDISDYKSINSKFGSMEDFDALMHEAKIRDIKIIMDLVINHTSTEHRWFKEAINNPTTKYRDYYYFSRGRGKKFDKAPNNWQSVFVGSAWKPLETDKTSYYLHLFCDEQADLNYHNEDVIKEVESIMRFWLDKGVYGFRCDTISNAWKTSLKNGKPSLTQTGKEHYENQDGNHALLERFRKDVLDKYDAFMVGEIQGCTVDIANSYIKNNELNMCITFEHQGCDKLKMIPLFKKIYQPRKLINIMFNYQKNCLSNCLYLENHDQLRSVSRFVKAKYHDEGAKAYALFLLTLKGTPFIYQGEEIGMTNMIEKEHSIDDNHDIVVHNLYKMLKKYHLPNKLAFKLTDLQNRDNERTPMQWNDRVNAGFNKGWAPWLKVNSNYLDNKINVEDESKDKKSILNFYKELIKYRNSSDVLKYGTITRAKSNGNIAKYIREYDGKKLLIIVNLSGHKIIDPEKIDRKIIISNYDQDFVNVIPPYFGAIYLIP
jgi:oligo-1,6-glucosidase